MTTTTKPSRRRRFTAVAAVVAAFTLIPAMAAHAQNTLNLEHDAVGETQIASTGSSIPLGPTTLSTTLNVDNGDLTGSMPLPGARTTFQIAGFIPVSADVSFEEVAPITGHIDIRPTTTRVVSTATYHVRLRNIRAAGLPLFAGPFCRTQNPVTIPANTPEDGTFNIITGGTLEGEYSIGNFQHCSIYTPLLNSLIPGDGNTVSLEVSNGRIIP